MVLLICGSALASASRSSGTAFMALGRFIFIPSGRRSGIALHRRFDMSSGSFSTRATSFMEFLVAIVPYVMMCATLSCPYLSSTHSSTRPLPSSSKSVSISGKDIRSGFRKRSNSRSYFIGSILVMPRQYATTDPAAEPRPGPTSTPSSLRAALMKSCTMRKYPGKPIVFMMWSSNFTLSATSSGIGSPYRRLAPSYASFAR